MPRYQFTIDGQEPASEVEWFPDDVTALKEAAQVTSELGRKREDDCPLVIAVRLSPTSRGALNPVRTRVLAAQRLRAERHVNEGRRIIDRQRRLLASPLPSSKIREEAQTLLSVFERSKAIFEADLAEVVEAESRT